MSFNDGSPTVDLELLTPDQVCDLLKIRKSWLYDEVEAGRFPHLRLGRQLRFRRQDIAAHLSHLAGSPDEQRDGRN
jgi:excisionase family DNA binding protein